MSPKLMIPELTFHGLEKARAPHSSTLAWQIPWAEEQQQQVYAKVAATAAKSLQLCPTLCNPPGSSIHGIFQARVLEWGALAFSNSQLLVLFK